MKHLAFIAALTLTLTFYSMTSNGSTSKSIYDLQFISLEGDTIKLSTFKGKNILFVNVASKCGFTSQYKDLQKLHELHKDSLIIIGFPCNQFGSQESGTESEIKAFCQKNYGVDFLMSSKIEVKGENQHPIYSWLTTKNLNGSKNSKVKWNFQKYLVDKQGGFVDYWYSVTSPTSSKIIKHLK